MKKRAKIFQTVEVVCAKRSAEKIQQAGVTVTRRLVKHLNMKIFTVEVEDED